MFKKVFDTASPLSSSVVESLETKLCWHTNYLSGKRTVVSGVASDNAMVTYSDMPPDYVSLLYINEWHYLRIHISNMQIMLQYIESPESSVNATDKFNKASEEVEELTKRCNLTRSSLLRF